MSRPKQYPSAAARQAAYRARMKATTAWVNRAPFEQAQAALERLHQAISRGVRQGDPVAQTLYRPSPEALVMAVADWFTARYAPGLVGRGSQNESSRHEITPEPAPRSPQCGTKNQQKD